MESCQIGLHWNLACRGTSVGHSTLEKEKTSNQDIKGVLLNSSTVENVEKVAAIRQTVSFGKESRYALHRITPKKKFKLSVFS